MLKNPPQFDDNNKKPRSPSDAGPCAKCRLGAVYMYYVPVDVVLPVGGQVVVDDEGDLLDVNPEGQQVRGDEDTAGAGPELPHDHIPFLDINVF